MDNFTFILPLLFHHVVYYYIRVVLYYTAVNIRNKQINDYYINICLFVHFLHVSIQLDHHQANIYKMYTRIELYC
jgi:hypothetical protein